VTTPVQTGNGAEPEERPAGRRGYTASTRPSADSTRRFAAAAEQAASRWPLSRITGAGVLAMALFSMIAIAIAGTALASQASARNRVETIIDPASGSGKQLAYDLVNQETGVRGYLLSGKAPFLAPYTSGYADQQRQISALRKLTAGQPGAQRDLNQLQARIDAWRAG
jgi:CHASE3 domain sensor protein